MNDDLQTPLWLMKVFQEWDDPCPLNGSGGLEREWGRAVFINPPYSNPLPWVQKAIEESKKGKMIVMLLRHDSSTEWWRILHEYGAHFLAFIGRLHYSDKKSANFPSVLVIL